MCIACGSGFHVTSDDSRINDGFFSEVSGYADGTSTVATITASGDDFDGILGPRYWTASTITYSFPTSASVYPSGYDTDSPTNGFNPLEANQIAAVRSILSDVSEFTDLNFTELSANSASTVMRFAQSDTPRTAFAYYPSTSEEGGDSWYNNTSYDSPEIGTFGYTEGFVHEIGHALGLKHGHESGGFGALDVDLNSNEFSVMTYSDYIGDTPGDGSENEFGGEAQTFMMLDIAALQYLYGADFSSSGNVWSGDSVYTFDPTTGEMFINGIGQGTPGANRIFRTIWDGHGEDTYDLSNYVTDLNIDLRPGEWSTFSQAQLADLDGGNRADNLARGNVANALLYEGDLRSLIENAIGGSGNDTILGNQGSNELTGNSGNDTLDGGDGNDVAIFNFARSEYTITQNLDGSVTVAHTGGTGTDGTDRLINIEAARFSDVTEVFTEPEDFDLTARIDVVFLQDLTGSFSDDLPFVRSAVDDIARVVLDDFEGSRFAVTSFRDRGDEFVYRVDSDFVSSPQSLSNIYDGLIATGGGDTPEAQLTALISAAMDPSLSYNSDNDRIFILATDATFQPYETIADVAAVLAANDIIPIFAVTSDVLDDYQDLVASFGRGVVVEITRDSSDLADSIRFALASITGEATAFGDSGDNTIEGLDDADGIFGLAGADTLNGNDGNDLVDGGSGDDVVTGGNGDDEVTGGSGGDLVIGNDGHDILFGGSGDDFLFGDDRPTYSGSGALVHNSSLSNTVASNAASLDGRFHTEADPQVEGSANSPHVTVFSSTASPGESRFYSFTVLEDGSRVTIDVDNAGFSDTFDTTLRLTDTSGNFFGFDDDSSPDVGSDTSRDSYITTALNAGVYIIELAPWSSAAFGTFRFHVSIDGPVISPVGVGDATGNDWLDGGAGADYIDGGTGMDTVSYEGSEGRVAVNLAVGFAANNDAEGDTLISIENLVGSEFNDTLRGDGGDNIIEGGRGRDVLDGQGGLDTVSYQTSSSRVVINLGSNFANGGDATGDIISNFERAIGSNFNDRIVGTDTGNRLFGGAGNDELDGGGARDLLYGEDGDDILIGGEGADDLYGGDGSDTASYENSTRVAINLGSRFASGGEATGDRLFSIENLRGSRFNDTLRGDDGDNIIEGGSGGDILDGQGGVDTVSYVSSTARVAINFAVGYANGGHATGDTITDFENMIGSDFNDVLRGDIGDNVIEGGAGGDILDGGGGLDTLSYESSNDRVVINLGLGFAYGGHATGDTISNFERVIGSAFNDRIVGTDTGNRLFGGDGNDELDGGGARDLLYGEDGDDILIGGEGADDLFGGDGSDTASYATSGARVALNLSLNFTSGGDAAGDRLHSIENLIGSDFNDVLRGDDGANTIEGGAGGDILDGLGGIDTLSYTTSGARVAVNIGVGYANGGDATGDTIVNFENLIGSDFNDTLVGSDAANRIEGGVGNDTIRGGAGDDTLVGGNNDDSLYGGLDDDRLFGGFGNDTLVGGEGDDILTGGSGSDIFEFTVDLIEDTFTGDLVPGSYFGADTITDFTSGVDTVNLEPLSVVLSDYGIFDGSALISFYMFNSGVDAVLDLDGLGLGVITFQNMQVSDFSSDDFALI